MQTSVSFRHMDASDALKDHAVDKALRVGKYLDANADAHVVLSLERYLHKAEININAHGLIIYGKELSSDMYNSIDRAMEKIEKQIKRYRTRLSKSRPQEGARLKMQFKLLEANGETEHENGTDLPPSVIESKEFQARPMMLDEAVMQMDLLHNDLLVFLNAKTNQINVLYRKKGNKYGLIETSANNAH